MTTLVVPMVLDGLLLDSDLQGTLGPFSDFSQLPWSVPPRRKGEPGYDKNADVPFTSQNALVPPLSDETGELERGLHLHWALPRPLTVGHHPERDDGTPDQTRNDFPHVPNRWLVIRWRGDKTRKWIVESDYLWPEGTPWAPGRVSFPVAARGADGFLDQSRQPYRYLGRAYELGQKPAPLPGEDYLEKLIAPGYGEMAFNAVYSNCRNVFGFHDPLDDIDTALTPEALRGANYHVYGWYSDSAKDEICRRSQARDPRAVQRLGWTWATSDEPNRLLCAGSLRIDKARSEKGGVPDAKGIKVVVANTGTEALSAHIARDVSLEFAAQSDGGEVDRAAVGCQVEHQLEALHLTDKLKAQTLDLAAKFREARHDKTFHSVPSGRDWVLVPDPVGADMPQGDEPRLMASSREPDADTTAKPHEPEVEGLPDGVAAALDELNRLQDQLDQLGHSIADQRQTVFSQWHKFITCCYHPDDVSYPSADLVKAHITDLIAALDRDVATIEGSHRDTTGAPLGVQEQLVVSIGFLTHALKSLAEIGDVARIIQTAQRDTKTPMRDGLEQRLAELLAEFSKSFPDLAKELRGQAPTASIARLARLPSLKLAPTPAAPFWQANDPVILMVGEGTKRTDRHDDHHSCATTPNLTKVLGADSTAAADKVAKALLEDQDNPARRWPDRRSGCDPWHPILLEWKVAVETQSAAFQSDHGPYQPGCLEEIYHLKRDQAEALKAKDTVPDTTASSYIAGRSILSGHAAPMLRRRMIDYLKAAIDAFRADMKLLDPELYPEDWQYIWEDLDEFRAAIEANESDDPDRDLVGVVVHEYAEPFSQWAQVTHGAHLAEIYLTTPYLGHADESALETRRGVLVAGLDEDVDRLAFFQHNQRTIFEWSNEHGSETVSAVPPVLSVMSAFQQLADIEGQVQTQALGGFNEGLLMHEQVLQFDPVDPLGFAENRTFTEELVRNAVAGQTRSAPVPHADFHPLRMGTMKIVHLRLVDSFGRVLRLDPNITTTHQLDAPSDQHVELLPRITQPARLNLNWRSAAAADQPTNHHPASNPLCGWVVPDNFNGGVALYNASGVMLGGVAGDGRWRVAPGRDAPAFAGAIDNRVLGGLVNWLEAKGQRDGFIDDFVALLNRSLENIDPEGFESHLARALTSGRPMALVRLSVGIELMGRPAQSQSWDALQQDLAGQGPDTFQFGKVRVPLRLGEHGQLNDGLVGFWTAPPSQTDPEANAYQTPLGDASARQGADAAYVLERIGGKGAVIWRAIEDPPLEVVALMDPRGALHVTSGVLPTRRLRLPHAQFAAALGRLDLPLRVGPLITGPDRTELPLPKDPGLVANWIQRDGPQWTRRGTAGAAADGLQNARTEPISGPRAEIREGWLTLSPNTASNEGDTNV